MALERIAVIGGGLMGAGIAQVFASRGYPVRVHEPAAAVRGTVLSRIAESLELLGEPALPEERVLVTSSLGEAVESAEVVFEAAPERLELKRSIFVELERLAPADCTLASNTSVIPIRDIAADVRDGGRVIGTHWWNPPYLVPLVEVVGSVRSDPERVTAMLGLLERVGKKPVRVCKDVPGFVGNRLQHALWREAQALVSEGVCDAETVDTVVKNSFGLRLAVLGPIENADLVGLDLALDIHRTVIPGLSNEPGPSPMLTALVAAGKLGFKTGEGFRCWTPEQMAATRRELLLHLQRSLGITPSRTPSN